MSDKDKKELEKKSKKNKTSKKVEKDIKDEDLVEEKENTENKPTISGKIVDVKTSKNKKEDNDSKNDEESDSKATISGKITKVIIEDNDSNEDSDAEIEDTDSNDEIDSNDDIDANVEDIDSNEDVDSNIEDSDSKEDSDSNIEDSDSNEDVDSNIEDSEDSDSNEESDKVKPLVDEPLSDDSNTTQQSNSSKPIIIGAVLVAAIIGIMLLAKQYIPIPTNNSGGIDATVLKQIDSSVDMLLEEYQKEVSLDKKDAIANGDVATIEFKGTADGKEFTNTTNAQGEKAPAKLIIGKKSFVDNFEDQLIGKKAGDNVNVNVTFPKDYQSKELQGKKALFEVKIIKVATLHPLNKEFVSKTINLLEENAKKQQQTLEPEIKKIKTVEELKASFKKAYIQQYEAQQKQAESGQQGQQGQQTQDGEQSQTEETPAK